MEELEPSVAVEFNRMTNEDKKEGLDRWNKHGIKPTQRWCKEKAKDENTAKQEKKNQDKLKVKASDVELPKNLNIKPMSNEAEQRVIDKHKKAIFKEMEKHYADDTYCNCSKLGIFRTSYQCFILIANYNDFIALLGEITTAAQLHNCP